MITKTDQEITVTGKYKISLGVETEVLHPYQSGLEIEVKLVLWLMTTKNAVEIWGGVVCYIMMATKTDQEIIVSRKYESGLEIEGWTHVGCMVQSTATALAETEVTRFVSDEKWGGNTATECMSQKAQHGDV